MAATVTAAVTENAIPKEKVFLVALDNSYATGGYPVPASAFGVGFVEQFIATETGGYAFSYDSSAGKLKVYDTGASSGAPLSEVSNGTDLSAITIRALVLS